MSYSKINRAILRLALPSVVSNITVPLLSLVDLSIVGHLGQQEQIGAIAIGSMGFNMLYWIFAFLRMGTTGLTSQAHGAKQTQECATALLRALLTGIVISLLLCALQVPLQQLISLIMQPSKAVLPYFTTYFRICIWGAPAILCSYALTGWFIGMQNTRIPMLIAITQNILNIAISLILVLYLDWGLKGVALGTVIGLYAGLIMALLLAHKLWRKEGMLQPALSHILNKHDILKFATVNTDIFLRTICLVCVMTFFTSAGSMQGDTILAANTLLMEFFMLYSFFMDGLANAAEALSGEHHGANDYALLRTTIIQLFKWAINLGILFTMLYIIGGLQILQWLTNQYDVISTAYHYLPWIWTIPLLSVMAFIWDGVYIGLCWSRRMLISMFFATVVFFIIYFSGIHNLHNSALWLAFVSYLATRGLTQTALWFAQKRKNKG